jgi:F0F1-type ATP synthase membrane subunit b/b'
MMEFEVKRMEDIINKIIEIDQKAWNFHQKKKEMIENNEAKLKKVLEDLEKEILAKAKKEGKEKIERLIREGEDEKEKILQETEAVCEALEKTFLEVQEDLGEAIFHEIVG